MSPDDDKPDSIERPCSVKLSINAKGNWSGELKAYSEEVHTAFLDARATAVELEKLLNEKNERR